MRHDTPITGGTNTHEPHQLALPGREAEQQHQRSGVGQTKACRAQGQERDRGTRSRTARVLGEALALTRLDREPVGAAAGCDGRGLDRRADQSAFTLDGELVPVACTVDRETVAGAELVDAGLSGVDGGA
jgi:hypothetical protein